MADQPPVSLLALPGDRALAFRPYGPAAGTNVLFVPGAASGSAMRFGQELLHDRGLRLISVDRPGLGGSTADERKSLASVGDDLLRLTARLGGPLPIVANSQGAPFALAAALAGAASRLVLVSPADEVAYPAITRQLPEPVRALVAALPAAPENAAARFADFSADRFFDFVLGDYPVSDSAVYGDPGFRALFRAALGEGFAQGPDGYARDTALAMLPWALDLGAIDVPVTVLFGGDDTNHSPDLGATLATRIPAAERVVVPGVGGSLLWARPELALDAASAGGAPKRPR